MPRLYLHVPYAEKDDAKALGARWDPKRRSWYIPDASLLDHAPALRKWLPAQDIPATAPSATPKPPTQTPRHKASATQLAQLTRCEQQAVFDRLYGRTRSSQMRQRQKEGIAAHKAYEARVAAGERPRATPCFIASATFGQDAFETWTLRRWRNARLSRSAAGRALIRAYERLSPSLARWLARHPAAAAPVRGMLRLLMSVLRI